MRTASLITTIAAAVIAIAGSATDASAAQPPLGGGCTPHAKSNGWDIGVCISNRGTQTQVYPDIYVNTVGTKPNGCYVRVYAYDGTIGAVARTNDFSCQTGHDEIPHFNATPYHVYVTKVTVLPAGYNFDISPSITYY